MSIWGKILGGAAGAATGGALGALVSGGPDDALVSGAADPADAVHPARPDGVHRIAFTIGVIILGAKMAKADGVVTRPEIAAFREVFQVPPHDLPAVARLFDRARRDSLGFETYARQIARLMEGHAAVLEDLLDGLFHIARADGTVHRAELDYLRAVAEIFGIDDAEFERIRAANGAADPDDPYIILGLDRGADADAVKSAHRRLVRLHHPDALVAQGLPPEFLDLATEKMAVINAAYDRIRSERGL
jgi:DnaJ like chaperone protein